MKNLMIPLQMNYQQKNIIDGWINTSNYIYNKTLEKIKNGHKANFINLRDMLVTNKTKKHSNEYNIFNTNIKNVNVEIAHNKKQLLKFSKNNLLKEELEIKICEQQELLAKLNKERRDNIKKIKSEQNTFVKDWQLETPKEIRAYAVKKCCNAYTTALGRFYKHEIKYFNMKFRKKK
jgi:hypothetical protein